MYEKMCVKICGNFYANVLAAIYGDSALVYDNV